MRTWWTGSICFEKSVPVASKESHLTYLRYLIVEQGSPWGRPCILCDVWWRVHCTYLVSWLYCGKGQWWSRKPELVVTHHIWCLIMTINLVHQNVRRWCSHIWPGSGANVQHLAVVLTRTTSTMCETQRKRKLFFCWLFGSLMLSGQWNFLSSCKYRDK